MKIHRKLVQINPDAYLPDLASSLNNLGNRLSALGQHEPALEAAQEAVEIRSKLVKSNPDAYLPDLAMSCGARGDILLAMERNGEAADSFAEGLVAIVAPLQNLPQAFAQLAASLLKDYLHACEADGREPDMQLLGPIVAVLETLKKEDGE